MRVHVRARRPVLHGLACRCTLLLRRVRPNRAGVAEVTACRWRLLSECTGGRSCRRLCSVSASRRCMPAPCAWLTAWWASAVMPARASPPWPWRARRRAAEQWADDTLCHGDGPRRCECHSDRLRRGAAAAVGRTLRRPCGTRCGRHGPPATPAPLRALFLIDRSASSPADSAARPHRSAAGRAPARLRVFHDRCRRRRLMIEQYLALVDVVPVYRLSYPSKFECLPEVVDLVRRQIIGPTPVAAR